MYRIGEAEVKRIQKLFDSGKIFRYGSGEECEMFEKNWGRYVGPTIVVWLVRGLRRCIPLWWGWGLAQGIK